MLGPIVKESLYGSLDPTTLEWTDGVFTKVLREVRGQAIHEYRNITARVCNAVYYKGVRFHITRYFLSWAVVIKVGNVLTQVLP